jgi:hypothetical protein
LSASASAPEKKAPCSWRNSRAISPDSSSPPSGWISAGISAKCTSRICTNSGVPRKNTTYACVTARSASSAAASGRDFNRGASRELLASPTSTPSSNPALTDTTVSCSVIHRPAVNSGA